MSISQLDDPSMRTALGIETDTPSSFANPIQIGTGAGATLIANGRPNLQQGFAFFNGLDANGGTTASAVYVNDPAIDENYANAVIEPRQIGFQQEATGVFVPFATFNGVGPQTDLIADRLTCGTTTVQTGNINVSTINGKNFNDYAEVVGVGSTAVGGGGSVVIPLFFNEVGDANDWQQNAGGIQWRGTYSGVFNITASISLDTASPPPQTAIAHLELNGVPIAKSASATTIFGAGARNNVFVQNIVTMQPLDTLTIVLSSTDPAMTAQDYVAVVGPPPIPEEPSVLLLIQRIA